jgi:hypothetical protein
MLLAGIILWTWTTLCTPIALFGDTKLKEADHKSMGKLVGGYYAAMSEEKGIFEALQKILDQITSLEKRLKGEKLLACVSDWEQIFRVATEDRLQENLKKKGEVTTQTQQGEIKVSFAYCVPKKPAKGALPLILIACNEGEAPATHLEAYWNDPAIREGAILMAVDLGKDTSSWGLFGSRTAPGGTYVLMTALGMIQDQFPVDYNRRFLVGSGKGFAAVEVTATSYPHIFAGVIGIGDVTANDFNNFENYSNLPSLFIKGGEGANAIEAKLKEYGYSNCQLEPEGTGASAFAWMSKNPRASYPPTVVFSPRLDNASKVHWLSISGFQSAEKPRIEAKADRAANTITIDAQKIAGVIIYLNDSLVDLDKPVKFVVNGVVHERKLERNAPEMIKDQFHGGDWGRVYCASLSQDVSSK